MKRCFLLSVLSLFAFVAMVLFFNSSNCYAVSYEDIKTYANNTADYFPNNSYYQTIKNNVNKTQFETVINSMDISSYTDFYLSYHQFPTRTEVLFTCFTPESWVVNNGVRFVGYYKTASININSNGTGSNNTPTYNNGNSAINYPNFYSYTANQENSLVSMIYTSTDLSQNYTLPPTFVGLQGMASSFEYLEFVNDVENSAYNGNIYTYYIQGDFYSSDKIQIGHIVPNDSYYFELRLKDSVSQIVKGTSFVSLNTSPNTYYNDGAIYIDGNNEVYIIPRLLKFSQQYQLEIISYYGDGGDNLYEDIDWFIFLPFNAVVSGDYILSLGSGDYTTQDSTNDIMGFLGSYTSPSGDIQGILNSEGSLLSGDLFDGVQMPVLDGMKNYNLFDLLQAIGNCVGGSGDAYFDFQMHGETPTRIYASQFRTPDGALKTLVSSFLVFFTFYFLVLQLRHVLEMLTTANIKGAIDYVDSSMDNMFYM